MLDSCAEAVEGALRLGPDEKLPLDKLLQRLQQPTEVPVTGAQCHAVLRRALCCVAWLQ